MKYSILIIFLFISSCSYFYSEDSAKKPQTGFTDLSQKDPKWIAKTLDVQTLAVEVPKISSWIIENGIEVNYLEDPELPIVSGTLLIPNGIYLAKQQGNALAVEALGNLMRTGGAGKLSPEHLDLRLAELAASISVNFSAEMASISFSCLEESLSEVLPIFQEIILNPQIDQTRLDNWKKQKIASIKGRKDSPNDIASITFNQLLNRGTAFENLSTISDVEKLTQADLIRMHRAYVIPNKAKLILTGSMTEVNARQIALDYFAKWQLSESFHEKLIEPLPINAKGIYFFPGEYEQSTVLIGHRGVSRLTPDHYAIQAFNDIFGAKGFTSRLTNNIRKKNGWAYSTYGGMIEDVIPGKNLIYLQTKAPQTVMAIQEAIKTLVELQKVGATPEELSNVKRNIANSFVFDYDNYEKIVGRFVALKLLGYPENYQEEFINNIDRVTLKEVQNVAINHWNINDFIVVVVGPSSTYNLLETAVADSESFLYQYPLTKINFNEQAEF